MIWQQPRGWEKKEESSVGRGKHMRSRRGRARRGRARRGRARRGRARRGRARRGRARASLSVNVQVAGREKQIIGEEQGGLSAIRAGSGHWEWIAEAVVSCCATFRRERTTRAPMRRTALSWSQMTPAVKNRAAVVCVAGGGGHQQEGEEAAGDTTHFQLHNASSGEQLHPIMKEQPALRHRGHPCRIPARHGDGAVGGWRLQRQVICGVVLRVFSSS